MAGTTQDNLTVLIVAARQGDRQAKDRLFEVVYEELRRLAHRSRWVGREGETMQATALANEAYLALNERFPVAPHGERENRETFYNTVARAMRTILRDYWRKKRAQKRGGDKTPIALGAQDVPQPDDPHELDDVDFLSIDEALDGLEMFNRRWFDVVMHRYFAGRSVTETAELMGVGVTTVKTDWQLAQAWLRRELQDEGAS